MVRAEVRPYVESRAIAARNALDDQPPVDMAPKPPAQPASGSTAVKPKATVLQKKGGLKGVVVKKKRPVTSTPDVKTEQTEEASKKKRRIAEPSSDT